MADQAHERVALQMPAVNYAKMFQGIDRRLKALGMTPGPRIDRGPAPGSSQRLRPLPQGSGAPSLCGSDGRAASYRWEVHPG